MVLDQAQLKQRIIEIVKEKLKDYLHCKVFLFGSRVNGQATERSDIDIGIEAETEIPATIKLDIEDQLDRLPTLNKFDFVDFKTVSPEFKKMALENIEVLYEK